MALTDSNRSKPQYNLAVVNEVVADNFSDRPAIICRNRRLTHLELAQRTRQFARFLRENGVALDRIDPSSIGKYESQQDHVAIIATNGNEYLEAMLGAFKARAVPVNVNYRYVAEELLHILTNSSAKAIVYESSFAEGVAEVLPVLSEVKLLVQIDDGSNVGLLSGACWYEDAIASKSNLPLEWSHEWSPDDLYLLYTGGTTGLPKAVLWRQADIHRSALGGRNPSDRMPWQTLDELVMSALADPEPHIVLPTSPFMHGAGHWTAFQALNLGNAVVIQNNSSHLDAADICTTIDLERVTYLQLVGDAFCGPILDEAESRKYDLSSIRLIRTGGTALSMPMRRRIFERLPHVTLMDSMGSSESGGQGVRLTVRDSALENTTFIPVEGSVVISSARDRLLNPGDAEDGWLAKYGDIALGYLDDVDKSEQSFPTILGTRFAVPGDRARWLKDGSIELRGRDSATINSGGEKIFAEEVESAILGHVGVKDVVVASRPSPKWGQEVVAIVSLRNGEEPSISELEAEAGRHIARFKLPKVWIFVDEVVRLPAGKPNRRWADQIAVSTITAQ